MKQKISITVNDKILRDVDSIVDNIYIRNRSQAFEYLVEKAMEEDRIAVILAGEGRGNVEGRIKNRYSLNVCGRTILERAIKKLNDSGFRKIYIIANHEILTNIFKIIGDGSDRNLQIEFITEELENGSASALKLLKGKIKTTFLVIQCDVVLDNINLRELWHQHIKEKMVATMRICSSIIPSNQILFGHVNLQGNKVLSYIEKPAPKKVTSTIFFGGAFVAEPEIFGYPGRSLEIDIFPELARKGLMGGQMSGTEHLHVHTREDLKYVRKKIKENIRNI
jgi:NDP-sugar pyrophosphorylase family protein